MPKIQNKGKHCFTIFGTMNFGFFDPKETREDLLPLTYTRPCSELRVGVLTIREKWETQLGHIQNFLTQDYLSEKYQNDGSETVWINGCLIPSDSIITEIKNLKEGESLISEGRVLAYSAKETNLSDSGALKEIESSSNPELIEHLWDIFSKAGEQISADLERSDFNRGKNQDPFTRIYNEDAVYLHPSSRVKASILNAEEGPIIIDEGAVVHEGSILYGPLYVGKGSQISPGSKIRSNTSIGPFCKVGGEVNNVVFQAYSNKGHDGFLGNAVIGEWCNLGADTNNSNLKNNYDEVKLWNFRIGRFEKTGLQFCGLVMGDHSKCSINTMFNTGTVTGIGANIFGAGFHANFIPSFSWGGPQGRTTFHLKRFLETARIVMKRRNMELDERDEKIFESIFNSTANYRSWEK